MSLRQIIYNLLNIDLYFGTCEVTMSKRRLVWHGVLRSNELYANRRSVFHDKKIKRLITNEFLFELKKKINNHDKYN
jgi:hypothetical protein